MEQRAALHDVLRRYREPHDTYFTAAAIGDEATVPLLLERFRLDTGTHGPPAPPPPLPPPPPAHDGNPATFMASLVLETRSVARPGFACVHHHLVQALANTTNVDRGLYYPAWDAWWRANGHLSQAAWIANGFTEAGLHVADPIDERFAVELIGAAGGEKEHLQFNALRVLRQESPARRRRWIEAAAASERAAGRLGAVRVVTRLEPDGYEDVLRRLASDADAQVAREALTALNARLRRARVAAPAVRIEAPAAYDRVRWIVETPGGLQWGRASRLVALDAVSGRLTSRPAPDLQVDRAARAGDRLVTASYEGDLSGIDATGRTRWRAPTRDARQDRVFGLVASGDLVVVARERRLEWWEPASGTVQRIAETASSIYDLAAAGNVLYVATKSGLLRIDGARTRHLATDGAAVGVSVGPAGVCVTSKVVGCYDAATLEPRWTAAIESAGTWGRRVAPLQAGARVIVVSGGQFAAHDATDGRVLWATTDRQSVYGALATPAGFFVTSDSHHAELRDLTSGEVLAAWPMVSAATLGAAGSLGVIGGTDGSTWRVDLSAASARRP